MKISAFQEDNKLKKAAKQTQRPLSEEYEQALFNYNETIHKHGKDRRFRRPEMSNTYCSGTYIVRTGRTNCSQSLGLLITLPFKKSTHHSFVGLLSAVLDDQ